MINMPSKVHDAMYRQCQNRGYAAPVDVLMDIGVLDKTRFDDWRTGRIPYLETACTANLHKLSEMIAFRIIFCPTLSRILRSMKQPCLIFFPI